MFLTLELVTLYVVTLYITPKLTHLIETYAHLATSIVILLCRAWTLFDQPLSGANCYIRYL